MAGAGGLWREVSHVDPGSSRHCQPRLRSGTRRVAIARRIRTIGSSFVWDCMAPALARSRLAGVQPAARRQPHTMLWVRACQTAMLRTLSKPRTTNCRSPRLRAWALEHSAVAAPLFVDLLGLLGAHALAPVCNRGRVGLLRCVRIARLVPR